MFAGGVSTLVGGVSTLVGGVSTLVGGVFASMVFFGLFSVATSSFTCRIRGSGGVGGCGYVAC